MKKSVLFILSACAPLMACSSLTMDKLNAEVQEATTVSCLLSSGAQIAFTVGTAVADAADIQNQKVLQASTKIADGSSALCNALTQVNSKINAIPGIPAPSADLVTTPSPTGSNLAPAQK
jgi:hypothetical protein